MSRFSYLQRREALWDIGHDETNPRQMLLEFALQLLDKRSDPIRFDCQNHHAMPNAREPDFSLPKEKSMPHTALPTPRSVAFTGG